MRTKVIVALAVMALQGCANSPDKLNCDQDWEAFGLSQAKKGNSVRDIDRYREACPNFNESTLDLYLDGYALGLVDFCSYKNGYDQAIADADVSNVCPYEIRKDYLKGYKDGARVRGLAELEEKLFQSKQERAQVENESRENLKERSMERD